MIRAIEARGNKWTNQPGTGKSPDPSIVNKRRSVKFDPQASGRDNQRGESPSAPHVPYGHLDSESDVVEADLIWSATENKPRSSLSLSGWFAWLVVCGVTLLMVSLVAYSQFSVTADVGGDATEMDLMPIQLQGKLAVAQKNLTAMQGQPAPTPLPPTMDSGPYEQRLCFSILLNEMNGPAEAIEHMERTDEAVKDAEITLTDDQSRLREILLRLLDQYELKDLDSSSLPRDDQEFLKSKLLWLGELALLPEESPLAEQRVELVSEANRLMTTGVVGLLTVAFFGFIGFLAAVLFFVLILNGTLKARFKNGQTNTNIYIETFAIWMCLFFGSSLALGLLDLKSAGLLMTLQPIIVFGSLTALVWPVVRGVPFSQFRQEIGWTVQNPLKEVASSFGAYPAIATFLLPGFIIVLVLTSIVAGAQETHEFARQPVPSHPIQQFLADGDTTMILLVVVSVCVAAPVVEETMFRGVLYRHLRDLSGRWHKWASVIFAALLNGVIFASIHPQGLVAIPLLTTLAIGFSLAREWRDSLVCPMVMHGIHNGLVTCVGLLIL